MPDTSKSFSARSRAASPVLLIYAVLFGASALRSPLTSVGPVLDQLMGRFGMSGANAGLLNALPLLLFAFFSPPSAWLGKRLGLERMLVVAMALITGGTLLRSVGNAPGLWAGTIALSLGIAIGNVLLVPIIKRDLAEHAARYIGFYAAAMALTASVASGIATPLSDRMGWQGAIGLWAALALVAAITWLVLAQRVAQPGVSRTPHAHAVHRSPWTSAIGWQVSLFMALQTMVFYTLIDWFPAMASDSGINNATSGVYLLVYQAVAVVANLGTASLIKRSRDQRLIGCFASLCIVLGIACLWWAPSLPLVGLLFAGIGAGMSMVTCLTLFGLRTRDHHHAGQLSGMAQCVGYGVGALGPWVTGVLHENSGGWRAVMVLLLAAACVQVVVAIRAGPAITI